MESGKINLVVKRKILAVSREKKQDWRRWIGLIRFHVAHLQRNQRALSEEYPCAQRWGSQSYQLLAAAGSGLFSFCRNSQTQKLSREQTPAVQVLKTFPVPGPRWKSNQLIYQEEHLLRILWPGLVLFYPLLVPYGSSISLFWSAWFLMEIEVLAYF